MTFNFTIYGTWGELFSKLGLQINNAKRLICLV